MVQAQADLTTAIELYNAGITQLEAGDADGQLTVDLALQQITAACETAGNADIAACLAAFGFPPLAEVPVVEVPAEPAPAPELSPAIDEAVTPDAIEALPVEVAPEEAAPLLDSAKDVQTEIAAGEPPAEQPPQEPVPTEPVVAPTTDAEAQSEIQVAVESVQAVEGQKIAEQPIILSTALEEPQAAAEAPDEFFAVASEAFFVTPRPLKEEQPALYRLLASYYRQDPALY